MADEQKATFEQSAEFHTFSGGALKVDLRQLTLTDADLRLSGEVTPETFMAIGREMAFNMLPQVRKPYDAATFREDINIEIELMLRPALLNAWREQGLTEIEDMLQELFASDTNAFYMQSELWLLTSAVQTYIANVEQRLFSKAGFQTLWAKELETDPTPQELIAQYLDDQGWNYDSPEDGVVQVLTGTDAGRWALLIDVDDERQLVQCLSVLLDDVPEARRSQVAEYLTNLNYNLAFGNFEMDGEDGDLRFRTSILYGSSPITAGMIASLIELNLGTMGDFFAEIQKAAWG